MNPVIHCQNVTFFREKKTILSNINIKMKRGEILLIKGKNGSGKTTLLKILTGIIDPSSGIITHNSSIAYLGHQNACRDYYTIEENLQFWSKIKNTTELIIPTMHVFGLLKFKDILYKNLSYGYKKKVAIAKLMILDSEIWILDEPFANLDDDNKNFLSELIKVKSQTGIVIFSSHEKEFNIESMKTFELTNRL